MTEEGNSATEVDKSGRVQVGGACEQWVTCGREGGSREGIVVAMELMGRVL